MKDVCDFLKFHFLDKAGFETHGLMYTLLLIQSIKINEYTKSFNQRKAKFLQSFNWNVTNEYVILLG